MNATYKDFVSDSAGLPMKEIPHWWLISGFLVVMHLITMILITIVIVKSRSDDESTKSLPTKRSRVVSGQRIIDAEEIQMETLPTQERQNKGMEFAYEEACGGFSEETYQPPPSGAYQPAPSTFKAPIPKFCESYEYNQCDEPTYSNNADTYGNLSYSYSSFDDEETYANVNTLKK
ncbi:uncharacterized protein LOC132200783 isoform X1 [Neocloeon triangulifer]|uniref:uncharacterized protein LOC132200783 isoform X1 n=1 Tax=Neocloeon triangulifer TaxID=2078957 RepID=UPI00286EBFBB|nr:uncharacterized protein LOC132200783 isoform X1 [Neocloeon triangulifer]